MNPLIPSTLKLAGSIGAAALAEIFIPGGSLAVKGVEAATGFDTGDFCKELIKSVSGNFTHQFANELDYKQLLDAIKNNKEALNHDIEKLMIASLAPAIQLLEDKYYEANQKDNDVTKLFEQLKKDATDKPYSFDDYQKMISDKNEWLGDIKQYIFTTNEYQIPNEIITYFNAHFQECFRLVFMEGLKNPKDEKPLKAFLIKTLTGIEQQTIEVRKDIQDLKEEISTEIKQLRNDLPNKTVIPSQNYFKKEFEKINTSLNRIEEGVDDLKKGQEELKEIITGNFTAKTPKELTLKIPKIHSSEVIGRENELADLKKLLFDNKHVVVVNGLGGIGKTTLAQAYLSQYYDDYQHIAWISQSAETSLESDFVNAEGLKENLKIDAENKDLSALFNETLKGLKTLIDKPNLLLIDNAETTLTQYFDYLPNQPNQTGIY